MTEISPVARKGFSQTPVAHQFPDTGSVQFWDRKDYISRQMLDGFGAFFKGTRQRLLEKIVAVLNEPPEIAEVATN